MSELTFWVVRVVREEVASDRSFGIISDGYNIWENDLDCFSIIIAIFWPVDSYHILQATFPPGP